MGDIRFYKNGKLQKNDCHSADDVKITFQIQKSEVRDEPAIRRKVPKGHLLCSVRIWASIVDHVLWSYNETTNDTLVNAILVNDENQLIKASTIQATICKVVHKLGEANLGIKASEVGTHSI